MHFKFRMLIDTEEYYNVCMIHYPEAICSGSRDLFRVWKINNDTCEKVQDRDIVAMED